LYLRIAYILARIIVDNMYYHRDGDGGETILIMGGIGGARSDGGRMSDLLLRKTFDIHSPRGQLRVLTQLVLLVVDSTATLLGYRG
jgi:hypothetical protein